MCQGRGLDQASHLGSLSLSAEGTTADEGIQFVESDLPMNKAELM